MLAKLRNAGFTCTVADGREQYWYQGALVVEVSYAGATTVYTSFDRGQMERNVEETKLDRDRVSYRITTYKQDDVIRESYVLDPALPAVDIILERWNKASSTWEFQSKRRAPRVDGP